MILRKFIVAMSLMLLTVANSFAQDYYVKSSGTNGDGLTYATAWVGLNNINWTSVDNGDGILYVDGTFTSSLTVGASGEVGAHVHVKGYTTAASVRGITIFNRSYVTIEDLITEGNTSGNGISIDTTSAQTTITIKNVISRNNYSWGVTHWGETAGVNLANLVLDGVEVYNNGLTNGGFPAGVFFGHNGGDITVKNSSIYNNGNAGQDHQIYVDAGSQGYIYNNTIHATSTPNSGAGIQCKGSCTIYNNIMHHSGQCGLQFTESSGATYIVYNNKAYQNGWAFLCLYGASNATLIFHSNSLYQNGIEGSSGWATEIVIESNLSSFQMRNNIVFGDGDQANAQISSQSNATYSNNIFWQGGAQATYQGSGGSYQNPLYVSPPSDMSLQSSSPARDNGYTLGSPYNVDILGVLRPQNSIYDMGAYEYGGSAPPPDTTPDPFSFTDLTNQNISTLVNSNEITISGMDQGQSVSISISGAGCQYSKNSALCTSNAGTAVNGDKFKLCGTTSANYETTYPSCTFTCSDVTDSGAPWTATTKVDPGDTTPPVLTNNTSSSFPYGTTLVPLLVGSDESSTCRGSTSSGGGYDSKESKFSGGGGTSHTLYVGSPTIPDDFGRADENPINSNWAKAATNVNDLEIISQAVFGTVNNARNGAYYSNATWPADQCSELSVSGPGEGPVILIQSGQTESTGIHFKGDETTYPGEYVVYRYNTDGTLTVLSHISGFTIGILKVCSNGSNITLYLNDTEIPALATSDSTFTSGYPGIYVYSSSVSTVSGDDWRGFGINELSSGTHDYYVICRDAEGNDSNELHIQFSISSQPAPPSQLNILGEGSSIGSGASVSTQ